MHAIYPMAEQPETNPSCLLCPCCPFPDQQPAYSCVLANLHTHASPDQTIDVLVLSVAFQAVQTRKHVAKLSSHDGTVQQAKLALGHLMNPPLALLPAVSPASQAPQPPATSRSEP